MATKRAAEVMDIMNAHAHGKEPMVDGGMPEEHGSDPQVEGMDPSEDHLEISKNLHQAMQAGDHKGMAEALIAMHKLNETK